MTQSAAGGGCQATQTRRKSRPRPAKHGRDQVLLDRRRPAALLHRWSHLTHGRCRAPFFAEIVRSKATGAERSRGIGRLTAGVLRLASTSVAPVQATQPDCRTSPSPIWRSALEQVREPVEGSSIPRRAGRSVGTRQKGPFGLSPSRPRPKRVASRTLPDAATSPGRLLAGRSVSPLRTPIAP
jgi:hypothetical protein